MRGIIWYYNNKELAYKLLNDIRKQYTDGTNMCRYSAFERSFINSNGDHWKAIPARYSARGNKCNVSYISYDIPYELIDTIIVPATIAIPFSAFKYYKDKEVEKNESI